MYFFPFECLLLPPKLTGQAIKTGGDNGDDVDGVVRTKTPEGPGGGPEGGVVIVSCLDPQTRLPRGWLTIITPSGQQAQPPPPPLALNPLPPHIVKSPTPPIYAASRTNFAFSTARHPSIQGSFQVKKK